mmetsp:Transcript_106840/g.185620  ORF Transcript_106840/g.185620 Transcript_106840/m.185620 type:complete len:335 (+) Transcript_106840:79-1083(+)
MLCCKRKLSLLLACLACVSHGRRLQTWIEGPSQKSAVVLDTLPSMQSLVEWRQPAREVSVKDMLHPIRALSSLLLKLNPAAQFNGGEQRQGSSQPGGGIDPMLIANVLQTIAHLSKLKKFPVVTSGVIALNVLAYYRQPLARKYLGLKDKLAIKDYGLQPLRVWNKRFMCVSLVLSSFLHASSRELINNMWSLLLKGSSFEESMRPSLFLDLMRYAAIAPNVVLVLATRIWANLSEDPAARAAYASSIYVDFSGALFCMSTIFNHIVLAAANQPVRMYGVALPAELASFAELAIDYVLNPGVSILRKASGLLAGLVYVYILPLLSHLLYMVLSK